MIGSIRTIAISLTLALTALLSRNAIAQPTGTLAQRAAEVVAVMQGTRSPAETFDTVFLAEVPPDRLAALAQRLQAGSGRLLAAEDVRATGVRSADFRLRFERATAVGHLVLEPRAPFKVSGFQITSVLPEGDTAEKIAADFAALPGLANFAVIGLGGTPRTILSHNADLQLALGSTFKLWVLDALAQDVANGRRRWDEVVRLGPRGLPSGVMQDWPADASVTVETLATLMISISDNTATDTLIRLIGRDRIGARLKALGHADPARTLPVLTTSENFALKLSPPGVREAYARADDAGQARMLAELDLTRILATPDKTGLQVPIATGTIEWFASPRDIARVLDSLRQRRDPRVLQILAVQPAMAEELRRGFSYVGYKGGSESGVLNLSWLARRRSGEWIVITAGWNDPARPLDAPRLEQLAQRLIRLASAATDPATSPPSSR